MTYEEQLKDPRWYRKRDKIISRDMGLCQTCMTSKNLDVHHKYYKDGKMAWDYPDIALVTLCNNCHKEEHGITTSIDRIPYLFNRIYSSVRAWQGLMASENGKKI